MTHEFELHTEIKSEVITSEQGRKEKEHRPGSHDSVQLRQICVLTDGARSNKFAGMVKIIIEGKLLGIWCLS